MIKSNGNFIFVATLLTIPALAWQVSGSYDDIWLATLSLCAYVAVSEILKRTIRFREVVLLGIITSSLFAGKLSLLPMGAIIVIFVSYKIFVGYSRAFLRISLFVTTALTLSSPQFLQKFIQSGNPVWPTYNGIFQGVGIPHLNMSWNLPFGPGDILSILTSPLRTILNPSGWVEGSSPGLYSASILIILIVIAISVSNFHKYPELVFGFSILLITLIIWFIQFRYLRYLIPTVVISVYMLTHFSTSKFSNLRLSKSFNLLLGGILLVGIPSGIPAVPERIPTSFAFGEIKTEEYLKKNIWAYSVLEWVNQNAEPNAKVLSFSTSFYQRLRLRTDIDLSWEWEISDRNKIIPNYLVYDGLVDATNSPKVFSGESYCLAMEFRDLQMAIYKFCRE
jgi:hypothetical protein